MGRMKRKATGAPAVDPETILESALTLKAQNKSIAECTSLLRSLYKTELEAAARFELAILCLQRADEAGADLQLRRLGQKFRLATALWSRARGDSPDSDHDKLLSAFEPAVSAGLYTALGAALEQEAFWEAHAQAGGMPWSYLVRLYDPPAGLIGQLIGAIRNTVEEKTSAKFVSAEWFAERGSADEAGLGFRIDERVGTPDYCTVLYLSEQATPMVVTECLIDGEEEDQFDCWRCHPAPNRMLLFKGSALHGKVPLLQPMQKDAPSALVINWWVKEPIVGRQVSRLRANVDDDTLIDLEQNMPMPKRKHVLLEWQKLLIEPQSIIPPEASLDCAEVSLTAIESCGEMWSDVVPQPAGEKPKKRCPGSDCIFMRNYFESRLAVEDQMESEEESAGIEDTLKPGQYIEVEEMTLEDLKRLRGK